MSASGTGRRARSQMISLRATQLEKTSIQERACARGLSMGAYMRICALDQPLPRTRRFTKEEGQFIAVILACVAALTDEVKRLEDEHRALLMTRQLLLIRDHCFAKLGRQP